MQNAFGMFVEMKYVNWKMGCQWSIISQAIQLLCLVCIVEWGVTLIIFDMFPS